MVFHNLWPSLSPVNLLIFKLLLLSGRHSPNLSAWRAPTYLSIHTSSTLNDIISYLFWLILTLFYSVPSQRCFRQPRFMTSWVPSAILSFHIQTTPCTRNDGQYSFTKASELNIDTSQAKTVCKQILYLPNQVQTIHTPLNQAIILTKAICMWERFENKDDDTAKENVFELNTRNLVMLKENCMSHHQTSGWMPSVIAGDDRV